MAGSAKTFNRTTVSTLSSEYLDYLVFVISAIESKESISKNTEELLRLIYNIDLPVITIINKIDLITDNELKLAVKEYKETIKKLNVGKIPLIMKSDDDVALFSSNMEEKDLALIFLVSTRSWDEGF